MPSKEAVLATYRYRLEFWAGKRHMVHEVPLDDADLAHAVEATFFEGLCQGKFTSYEPPLGRAHIEPVFPRSRSNTPRVAGFEVVLPTADGGEQRATYDLRYFHNQVTRAAADLVRTGKLPNLTVLLYQLAAYLEQEETKEPGRIILEPASVEVPLRSGAIVDFGITAAWDNPKPGEHRVLIPRHVLEEVVDDARAAPECEVGGVLLGHLRRDPQTGEVFVEVTCQVPAEETKATEVSVTFTGETWARVREVIEVRGAGEIFVGWVHSHPFKLCAECPLPVQPDCVKKVLFYSEDDEFLMEQAFARPFMIGLLTAAETRLESALGHLPVRLFGWRRGEIKQRGFEVIG
jgi:proteasome lid subunit RPN8/RPN11